MRKGVTRLTDKRVCEGASKDLTLLSAARRGALKGQNMLINLFLKINTKIVMTFGIFKCQILAFFMS
jgi:hypothetical protein